ncbi:MAG TPA: hypothetical protein VFE47_00355 [Tepidisphaeraceae bacterium]|jgi:hypothetical protein|nr:hypothetical protein [Tepidisphaeraceae bacterium]
MVISSRTPEGELAKCPVCGECVLMVPSSCFSDAPCPSCGALLWFVRIGEENILVHRKPASAGRDWMKILTGAIGDDDPGDDASAFERAESDLVKLVELVMESED